MRAAAPVEAVLSDGSLERMLIILLHACAGALLATWGALHAEWPPGSAMLVAALAASGLMAGVGAWLARRALPAWPGRLRWDGQGWHSIELQTDQPLARLVVAIDLGTWVLLQLHPAKGRACWRVASIGSAQASWHGLRVALAAHAGAARPGAGGAAP
ncbi:MAG: hypothetical protein QE285_21190 [Aquabacterium sp.]|nr:hypothetical protein [Aquabacterium sp.]